MTTAPAKATLIAGLLSLTGVAVAHAAPPPPSATQDAATAQAERRVVIKRAGPGGERVRFHRDPEARAQRLRDVLQLTTQQEPALQTYLTAIKPQVRMERRERPAADAPRPAPLTTPERLDKQVEMMAKRQKIFAERAAATKTFYAQLTPSQKKAFDALGLARGGHDRGPGPRVRMFRSGGPGAAPIGAPGKPMAQSDIVVGMPDEPVVTAYAAFDDEFDLAMLGDDAFDDVVILDADDF